MRRAIERYQRDGLESTLNYYNSVASFEGQWYLFATDENDVYNVHPLLPHLRGTDIKEVVDSSGFELGRALAEATEDGVWVEYLWPHPVTLLEAPKISYAARHDGDAVRLRLLRTPGQRRGPHPGITCKRPSTSIWRTARRRRRLSTPARPASRASGGWR